MMMTTAPTSQMMLFMPTSCENRLINAGAGHSFPERAARPGERRAPLPVR